MALINIRTVDDLKKVLSAQRMISRRVKEELLNTANDSLVENLTDDEALERAEEFIAAEQELLSRYAAQPTLSEWEASKHLQGSSHWGATFGVTVLVGELILEQVRKQIPRNPFQDILRPMYVLLLKELCNPVHEYLVEPLEAVMRFTIQRNDGMALSEEERNAYIRKLTTQLVECFLRTSMAFGITFVPDGAEGFAITPLGRRIFAHLEDAQLYISLVADAHTRLQGTSQIAEGKVE